jgi:hypothetical protein
LRFKVFLDRSPNGERAFEHPPGRESVRVLSRVRFEIRLLIFDEYSYRAAKCYPYMPRRLAL